MEHDVQPFIKFAPGNHLILGAVGVGKTRLIWSLLQGEELNGKQDINIVLTDHPKHLWLNSDSVPISHIHPYSSDLSWVTTPQKPGVYYAACDYLPRMHTFVECLSNYALNPDTLKSPVRVFFDFPDKFWHSEFFMEQIRRLFYISRSAAEDDHQLEIWSVASVGKDLLPLAPDLFDQEHYILLNPVSPLLVETVNKLMPASFTIDDFGENPEKRGGFYYLPGPEGPVYFRAA